MPFASVGDIDLYYELRGDGSPLVLIPGLGGDTRMFKPVVDALGPSFRTLTLDPRGAGRSSKPDIPYSITMLADDTAALMTGVGMPTAHILGLSMGGRIALDLALGHPEHVRGVILVSTSARSAPYRRPSWPWLVMDVLARLPVPRRIDPQPPYAHERQRAAVRSYDCTARLSEVRVPALILHGRQDHMVPFRLAVELHDHLQGSELVAVSGGHFALLTRHRQELVRAVAAFVSAR
jgi:3-oxoadipate enol-lactonase